MSYPRLKRWLLRHERAWLCVALVAIVWHATIMPTHQTIAALHGSLRGVSTETFPVRGELVEPRTGHGGHAQQAQDERFFSAGLGHNDGSTHGDSASMAFCVFCQSVQAYREPVPLRQRMPMAPTPAPVVADVSPIPPLQRYTDLTTRGPPTPLV